MDRTGIIRLIAERLDDSVRRAAVGALNTVGVAPVTAMLRGIPTCVPIDPDQGLDREGVATSDDLASVPRSVLTVRLRDLGPAFRAELCQAVRALADC